MSFEFLNLRIFQNKYSLLKTLLSSPLPIYWLLLENKLFVEENGRFLISLNFLRLSDDAFVFSSLYLCNVKISSLSNPVISPLQVIYLCLITQKILRIFENSLLVKIFPPHYPLLHNIVLWLLFDNKLCVEEDGRVDDLLGEHEDVKGSTKVGLMC